MVAPLIARAAVSTLAKAASKLAKNKMKKQTKSKGALKAKNKATNKKLDATKAAEKRKIEQSPSVQWAKKKAAYKARKGPKPTQEMINKAGPVKIIKYPKGSK